MPRGGRENVSNPNLWAQVNTILGGAPGPRGLTSRQESEDGAWPMDEDVTGTLGVASGAPVHPPVASAPDELPLRQLGWDDFERLTQGYG